MSVVLTAEDRSLAVPLGHVVRTDYVAVNDVQLACRDRMAVGDVKIAYERQLQLGSQQRWPCPVGHWSGDRFVIEDGRHQFVASAQLSLPFYGVEEPHPGSRPGRVRSYRELRQRAAARLFLWLII